jgi:serine/threonine protein phosphatase PrpC
VLYLIADGSILAIGKLQVFEHAIEIGSDLLLILASNGIFEFVSIQEAVAMVASQPSAQEGAEFLCREANKRWIDEETSCDDMSLLVVRFNSKEDGDGK